MPCWLVQLLTVSQTSEIVAMLLTKPNITYITCTSKSYQIANFVWIQLWCMHLQWNTTYGLYDFQSDLAIIVRYIFFALKHLRSARSSFSASASSKKHLTSLPTWILKTVGQIRNKHTNILPFVCIRWNSCSLKNISIYIHAVSKLYA